MNYGNTYPDWYLELIGEKEMPPATTTIDAPDYEEDRLGETAKFMRRKPHPGAPRSKE